jgi:NADH-quinone oxidoreductase subunit G
MPDSHRLNFHYIDSEARLTEPLIRETAQHVGTSWSKALETFSSKIKNFSADQIAIVGSARMTNEELYLLEKLRNDLGVENFSLVARTGEADPLLIAADRNPNTTGAKLVLNQEDTYESLATIRSGVQSGKIKALLSFHEDLVTDAGFAAEDLSKLDFFLHASLLANPSATHADIVLPGAAFAEKRGSMVNLSGRLQRLNRAIEPPTNARDDWEMIRDLISAVSGEKSTLHSIEDVFKKLAAAVPAFDGLTLSKIGAQGVFIQETGYKIALLENERARKAAGIING